MATLLRAPNAHQRSLCSSPSKQRVLGLPGNAIHIAGQARQLFGPVPADYESVLGPIRDLEKYTKRWTDQVFHCARVATSLQGFSLNRVLSASWLALRTGS
jgi:hypothetical protein